MEKTPSRGVGPSFSAGFQPPPTGCVASGKVVQSNGSVPNVFGMVELLDDELAVGQMSYGEYFAGLFFSFLLSGLDGVQKLPRRFHGEESFWIKG